MSAPTAIRNRIVGHGSEPPDQLLANPRNWRVHSRRQQAALQGALDEVGWVQNVIVNQRTGHILDGHMRVEVAISRGEPSMPVLYVDLTEAEEALVLASLDPISAMAGTDAAKLEDLLGDVDTANADLAAMFDDMARLAGFFAEPDAGLGPDGLAILDRDNSADLAPPERLQQQWGTALGQLWLIPGAAGTHRVLCADARDEASADRLLRTADVACVWTDPPYGVDYVGKTRDALRIGDDTAAGLLELLDDVFTVIDPFLIPGCPIYVAHPAGRNSVAFAEAFVRQDWKWHQTLVWVKNSMVLGHSDYHYQHEPILYGWKPGAHAWLGGRDKVSVFTIDRPSRSEMHPTMKPPALVAACLENSCPPGGWVLDPFLGSGSTLVASEALGRVCYGLDNDPAYVAVTLERATIAGLTPQLAEEA